MNIIKSSSKTTYFKLKESAKHYKDHEARGDFAFYVYDKDGTAVGEPFWAAYDAIEFAEENNYPVIRVHNYYNEPTVVWENGRCVGDFIQSEGDDTVNSSTNRQSVMRGTPEQFSEAVKKRIQQLGGNVEDPVATTASKAVTVHADSGTPQEFEQAVNDQIQSISRQNISASDNAEEELLDSLWAACAYVDGIQSIDFAQSGKGIIFTFDSTTDDFNTRLSDLISACIAARYQVKYMRSNGSNVIVLDVSAESTAVQSSTNSGSANVYKTLDEQTIERYIHNLIGDVQDILIDNGITSVVFDQDADNLYATLSTDSGDVTEYTIPFADLHFDFKDMIDDIDYVANAIIGIDSDTEEALTSASAIDLQVEDVIQADWDDSENEISEDENDAIADTCWEILENAKITLDTKYDLQDIVEYESREVRRDGNKYTCTLWLVHLVHDSTITISWTKQGDELVLDKSVEEYGQEIVDIYLEEYGTQEDVNSATNSCGIACKPEVVASVDDEDVLTNYTFVASKQVLDSDGFLTDYTWYTCEDGTHVFVFGDNDMYTPQDGYFDHVCDGEDEAQEWFDSYNGFEDDDDVYGSESAARKLQPGDTVYVKVSKREGRVLSVKGDYVRVELTGNNLPTRIDTFYTQDLELIESDVFSCDKSVACSFERDWYFGKEQSEQYGDLIADKLSGKTVSKRKDTAENPGGLIYEANQLGIDMWDLLGALEGMCYEGRAQEIDDSTYKVL